MNKWYVIKVIPGKERQVTEYFNNKIVSGEIKSAIRFLSPTEKEMVMISGKKVYREKVIYNGYVYIETKNGLTDDEMKLIAAAPSIMGMFGEKKPQRLSQSDVSRIIKDDTLEERRKSKTLQYEQGEKVKIDVGPFSGLNATIESIKGDKVVLVVKMFGDNTVVETEIGHISKP